MVECAWNLRQEDFKLEKILSYATKQDSHWGGGGGGKVGGDVARSKKQKETNDID